MPSDQSHLSTSEAAVYLNVSGHTIRRWIRDGRIRRIKLPGGRYRVLREDLDEILTPSKVGAA